MSIPNEFIEDILSRLPVKSLLRFRCVCPRWRDLIDSPNFVKIHLSRTIEADSHLNVLLCSGKRPYTAKFEPPIHSLDAEEVGHHPLRDEEELLIQVWGSCNGLVCLSNAFSTVALWNPSTREYLKLPDCGFRFSAGISSYQCCNKYGFGYDKASDDYKVLNILNLIEKRSGIAVKYHVMVYSVKSNSWRKVDIIYELPYMNVEPGHLAGGALHWLMGVEIDVAGIIVAFDLSSEEWRTVKIPLLEDFKGVLALGCFRDSICLLFKYPMGYMDIWVMKEYGVESSWTKLFSLRPDQFPRPVYFTKSGGEVFMQDQEELIWFDIKNSKPWYEAVNDTDHTYIKNVEVRGMNNNPRVSVYMESLVRLSGFRKMMDEKKPKEKKKNEMSGFLS